MSEKIKLQDSFDPKAIINDISISTTYIFALEELMIHYILNMENPQDVKTIYKKFEDYVTNKLDIDKDPFTRTERNLYTIYSLQQLFRAKAYEQGLNMKVKGTVSKDTLEELLKATIDGDMDKLKSLNEKMKIEIES